MALEGFLPLPSATVNTAGLAVSPMAVAGAGAAAPATILGMSPANFAAIAGLLASAIAPKGSPGANLGAVSTQIGQSKLTADAAELQDAKNKAFMKEIIASMGKGGMSSEQAIQTLNAAHTPLGGSSILDTTPKTIGTFGSPMSSDFSVLGSK